MILILGGTTEGREFMEEVHSRGFQFIGTVTSDYGFKLIPPHLRDFIRLERLTECSMKALIQEEAIELVIDCTHPYAVDISKLAITVCHDMKVSYIRYERPGVEQLYSKEKLTLVEDYEEVGDVLGASGKKALLSIGSRRLQYIMPHVEKENIFVRVLPSATSIAECLDAGVMPSHIIALQGPFSKEFNASVYKEYGIEAVVMKDSGLTGGTGTKIDAAIEMGVEPIIITKPSLPYPRVITDIKNLDI